MTPGVPRVSHLTHLPTPGAPNSQDAFMAAGGLDGAKELKIHRNGW